MTANLDPPRDPRAVLKAHRAEVPETNPAAERVERLLKLQGEWLRTRVRWTARNFHLDADELCQELMLGMLRRSTTVDEANQGVRSWLSVRVKRTAIDMVRSMVRSRGRDVPTKPDDFAEFERTQVQRGRLPVEAEALVTIDRERLIEIGLTPHEAQVIALRCTGIDINLKDFAALVHRTHASIRKEYERGIRKIEKFFDLTAEEAIMLRALRRSGSAHAAAESLNRPDEEVALVLKSARKKLDRLFDDVEGPS